MTLDPNSTSSLIGIGFEEGHPRGSKLTLLTLTQKTQSFNNQRFNIFKKFICLNE